MAREKTSYVTVRIPLALSDEIDKVLDSGIHGYRSRAEIVNEATRVKVEGLMKLIVMAMEV